jgi:hypothetical protein
MRTLYALLLIIALTGTAAADTWTNPYTGNSFNNPMSSLADTFIRQAMDRKMLENMYARKNGGGTATTDAPAATAKHEPWTKSDFKPGKKRLVVDTIIAGLAQNAEQQQGLATGINAVFEGFEKVARKNNVAYALAFMVAASVSVQTGNQVSDAQSEELAVGINDLLARSPGFAKASATDRQKLYETFVTLGGLVMLFAEVGKQDEASAKAAKVLATQSLRMVGGAPQ